MVNVVGNYEKNKNLFSRDFRESSYPARLGCYQPSDTKSGLSKNDHSISISLCNSLYKVVSRIILQHLKPFIAMVINLCQVGFVPGRQTSDNIILT